MKNNKLNITLIVMALGIYHLGYNYFNTSLVAQEKKTQIKVTGDLVLNCKGANTPSTQSGGVAQDTILNCTGKFNSVAD